jgi:hypothetical protein
MDDVITFTEEIAAARVKFDACIKRWSEGANANLIALVNSAFSEDKNGKLSAARVLGLNQIKCDDADWKAAIEILRSAVQVLSTKAYVRFYERDESGKYRQISLQGYEQPAAEGGGK